MEDCVVAFSSENTGDKGVSRGQECLDLIYITENLLMVLTVSRNLLHRITEVIYNEIMFYAQ